MSLLNKLREEEWKIDIEPCKYCNRMVYCGPPCCQGMIDELKEKEDAIKMKLEEEKRIRHEAKRQRRLSRRAERREQNK